MSADLRSGAPAGFLGADDVVDLGAAPVQELHARLAVGDPDDAGFARRAFEHVRDRVAHSYDVDDARVPVRASEVAVAGVGLCYAQSHLLAALLRVHGIPAGLSYQRLADGAGGHVLHGLVTVWVDGSPHRLDARGFDVEFGLDDDRLVYVVDPALGEADLPAVRPGPGVGESGVCAAFRGPGSPTSGPQPDVSRARLAG